MEHDPKKPQLAPDVLFPTPPISCLYAAVLPILFPFRLVCRCGGDHGARPQETVLQALPVRALPRGVIPAQSDHRPLQCRGKPLGMVDVVGGVGAVDAVGTWGGFLRACHKFFTGACS